MAWGTITSPHSTTSSQFGGDFANKVSKLFSNVDISQSPYDTTDIPIINTPWAYKDQKLRLYNPAGSFYYTIRGSAISNQRDLFVPLITGSDTLVVLNLAQQFTKAQTVEDTGSDPVTILRDSNTVNNTVRFKSRMKNASSSYFDMGYLRWQLLTNTAGSEKSQVELWARNGGVNYAALLFGLSSKMVDLGGGVTEIKPLSSSDTQYLDISPNLQTVANNSTRAQVDINNVDNTSANWESLALASKGTDGFILDVEKGGSGVVRDLKIILGGAEYLDFFASGTMKIKKEPTIELGQTDLLYLYRINNGVGDPIDINFDFLNSTSTRKTYADMRVTIVDPTNASEDAKFQLNLMYQGTKLERFRVEEDGHTHIIGSANDLLTLYQSDTANASNAAQLQWRGQDSVGNDQTWATLYPYVLDWTSGSEDSEFGLDLALAGSMVNSFWFYAGGFGIRDSGNQWCYIDVGKMSNSDKTMSPSNISGSVVTAAFLSGAVVTTSNTVTETDLLNVTIPAAAMGSNGMVRIVVRGYLLQNDAVGATFTFRTRFGGTIIHSDATNSYAQSATKLPFRYEVEIYNKNSSSANACNGLLMINDATGANTGIGDLSDDEISVNGNFDSEGADTAINTSSNADVRVTIAMSNASANTSFTKKHYSVEVMTS